MKICDCKRVMRMTDFDFEFVIEERRIKVTKEYRCICGDTLTIVEDYFKEPKE